MEAKEIKVYRDAQLIGNGACNPVAISRTLAEHSKTVMDLTGSMDSVRSHPALRVIAGQLGYLFGISLGGDVDDYRTVDDTVAAADESPQPAQLHTADSSRS